MYSKCFYLIMLLLFAKGFAYGQDMTGRDLRDHMLIDLSKKTDHSVKEFDGSPFLNEQFVAGEVYAQKTKYTALPVRYNIFNDHIEFKRENVIYALYPEPRITKVILGNETYVVEKYGSKINGGYGYFSRLDSGKVTLFSKKTVRFTEKKEPKALESAATPAKFTRVQDDYYYKIGSGEVIKTGSLKSLIENLPDKQEELTNFAKKEKLSTRNEEDLKKLVQYYNSL